MDDCKFLLFSINPALKEEITPLLRTQAVVLAESKAAWMIKRFVPKPNANNVRSKYVPVTGQQLVSTFINAHTIFYICMYCIVWRVSVSPWWLWKLPQEPWKTFTLGIVKNRRTGVTAWWTKMCLEYLKNLGGYSTNIIPLMHYMLCGIYLYVPWLEAELVLMQVAWMKVQL